MIRFIHGKKTNAFELSMQAMTLAQRLADVDLREMFMELRSGLLSQTEPNLTNAKIFGAALASAALTTRLQVTPYHVQLHAAIVMAQGGVAEMETGEGKTIAVAIAAAIIAASGQSVHIATSNNYLAARDGNQMKPVFSTLGLRVGRVDATIADSEKREAYQYDITYGTADGFAFDYLKDSLILREKMQSRLGVTYQTAAAPVLCNRRHAIVIDEVDHCLIDEAMTPLLLAGPAERASALEVTAHQHAADIAKDMKCNEDWTVDETTLRIQLTQAGNSQAIRKMPTSKLLRPWTEYVTRALDANHLLRVNVDYIIRNREVVIIDRATGRLAEGRQWQSGLYQAVQQKEMLPITSEPRSIAQITQSRFLSLYHQVSGCSGTAWDCRRELKRNYHLETTRIEPRLPSQRITQSPKFFRSAEEKWQAIVEETCTIHATGRPILIGTKSVAQSQMLARELHARSIDSRVLNGVQDEEEACIVSTAGQRGAITVATDMAGRGTDIYISDEVAELGGLHVIVTEPRHSSRLDRQLIGRCGRQGQPGSSQLFVAADDALLVQNASGLSRYLRRLRDTNSLSAHKSLTRAVSTAARRSEALAASTRSNLIDRDRRHQNYLTSTKLSRESAR